MSLVLLPTDSPRSHHIYDYNMATGQHFVTFLIHVQSLGFCYRCHWYYYVSDLVNNYQV